MGPLMLSILMGLLIGGGSTLRGAAKNKSDRQIRKAEIDAETTDKKAQRQAMLQMLGENKVQFAKEMEMLQGLKTQDLTERRIESSDQRSHEKQMMDSMLLKQIMTRDSGLSGIQGGMDPMSLSQILR